MRRNKPLLPALLASFENAKQCWSVTRDGQILGMFGVGHVAGRPGCGLVWMLAGNGLFELSRRLARESRGWIRLLSRDHDELVNYVHEHNRAALRWLQWLGFERVRLEQGFGRGGENFWYVRLQWARGWSEEPSRHVPLKHRCVEAVPRDRS